MCDKNLVKKWGEFYPLKTELFFEPGERFENLNCKVLLINTCLSTSLKLKCINYLQVINTLLIVNTRQNRYTYIYPTFACVNNSVNIYLLHWTQITVINSNYLFGKTCHYSRVFTYLSIGMSGLHGETSHLARKGGGAFWAIVEYSLIYFKLFFLIKNLSNIHLVLHKNVFKQSYYNTQK